MVAPGETFYLNVTIDTMGNSIAGLQMDIEFNGSLININDIIEGVRIPSGASAIALWGLGLTPAQEARGRSGLVA
jgi:hypothetical protein